MTQATENDDGIVWPDEEHLFAVDVSSDKRAGSHSSEGRIVSDGGTDKDAERNETNFAATATEASDANEFWDHDDRMQDNSNHRSSSPKNYPLTEEEADVWRHDKFDLLKIGPPPGLGDKRKSSAANQGLHQQYQTSRRTPPDGASTRAYRVLEVPRPPNTGQMPSAGWPDRSFGNHNFPTFSIDDLKEDSKTAWPEESEVRDEDISRWGWGDGEEATASTNASAPAEEPVSSTPASVPQRNRPGRSNHDRPNEHRAPRLSQVQEQTLQQVDQRNADLAAVMTRLRLQELRQQHRQVSQGAAYQQLLGHPPPAAQGSMGHPLQNQLPGPAVQYQFSNGVLVPSYAVPMPHAPALPSSPASMRPSMSHMFNQFSQQARPAARSGPLAPPQGHATHPLAQAQPSRPLDRSGAGYMASSRKGHQGYAPSSQVFPLKPGHLKGAQSSMLGMSAAPSPPPATPFSQVPASLQPPVLRPAAGAPSMESSGLVIGDPTRQAIAAAAAWASANSKGVPAAAQKPGKRALAIVDPESRQALPVPGSAASGTQLRHTDSNSSSHAEKPGKKLISIVDPTNKQPVQLPSKPLGPSRLIRTNSSTSAVSSDSSLPAKRAIPIVDPVNKQPVAIGSTQPQKMTAPASVRGSQPATAMSKRAKGPIAIVDPATASEVQLPAVDISVRKTGFPSTSVQSQGRMIRARKPLAIVDPKTKAGPLSAVSSTAEAQAAAPQSTNPSLAGASLADTVKLAFFVADDRSVKCSLHIRGTQSTGSRSISGRYRGDATRVQLLVTAEERVACSIVPSSGFAGAGSQQTGLTCSAFQ